MKKITLSAIKNEKHQFKIELAIDNDQNLYCSSKNFVSWAYDASNDQYYVHTEDVHNINCESIKVKFID